MLLLPKQETFPFINKAHVCAPPAATSDAVLPNDAVAVGVTALDDAVVPRRPLVNSPQHHAAPRVEIAQECELPISICATVNEAGTNDVYTGVVTAVVPEVPLPSCPLLLRPQHFRLLSDNTAHVVNPPAAIVVAVAPSVTCTGSGWLPPETPIDP
jgi:hypothetical protein